jgi:hypothetical protein
MTSSPRSGTQIDEYRQYDASGMTPFLDRNNSILDSFDVDVNGSMQLAEMLTTSTNKLKACGTFNFSLAVSVIKRQ